jgi:dUTP pyrophosphatase
VSDRVRVGVLRVRGERDADLPLPAFATEESAGADLVAAVESELWLRPGERVAVPTGLVLAIPPGYEGQVRARSGLALHHGITLPNAPGTIDADYRGEVQVILHNQGERPFAIRRGDRIAQLVIARVSQARCVLRAAGVGLGFGPRGAGGFGSTGRG